MFCTGAHLPLEIHVVITMCCYNSVLLYHGVSIMRADCTVNDRIFALATYVKGF